MRRIDSVTTFAAWSPPVFGAASAGAGSAARINPAMIRKVSTALRIGSPLVSHDCDAGGAWQGGRGRFHRSPGERAERPGEPSIVAAGGPGARSRSGPAAPRGAYVRRL